MQRRKASIQLLICGLCALFWELALIRWLGTNIRIIAYYSNFVLIAAFFGLGLGALLAQYRINLKRFIFPALAVGIFLGIGYSGSLHFNFDNFEYVWQGDPSGLIGEANYIYSLYADPRVILLLTYLSVAGIFVVFGQWIGHLFKELPPLWAYSIEISGSILGVIAFSAFSFLNLSPAFWFASGFILLLIVVDKKKGDLFVALILSALVLAFVIPIDRQFIWSPYYRIHFEKIDKILDIDSKKPFSFNETVGYRLSVNNDYHQMILDLEDRGNEHAFLASWRKTYDLPYQQVGNLPKGPILIVGAGTGNDVSAALRNSDREIYAVEIDPAILELGEKFHFEKPYANNRVKKINDDARSFFQKTDKKFALVVFGFLDSHTLLSSYSSIRLDNFVYTVESFNQVKDILLPGGSVYVTFASNRDWIHNRIIGILDEVFDVKTTYFSDPSGYSNGVVYKNEKELHRPAAKTGYDTGADDLLLSSDDWPFLYLKEKGIPLNYVFFMLVMITSAYFSLKALPLSQRKIKLPYFFLGAGFFLIETSNVISLSLLFGSTWYVNVIVFSGILILVLMGNISVLVIKAPKLTIYFSVLFLSLILSLIIPKSFLLTIDSIFIKAVASVLIFLSPVYFASLIFASLIRHEENLYQAYGSNILGAVIGGAFEYTSLIFGIKFLSIFAIAFYVIVLISMKKHAAFSRIKLGAFKLHV